MYEYARRAHCPDEDMNRYPLCGSASASHNTLDDQPITMVQAEFHALPDDVTCWECRSYFT